MDTIITLHGYLESNTSMTYFNEYFKNHGFNVISPNLIGHGTKYTDLLNVKYYHWIQQVEKIYNDNNGNIIIIGQSIGGSLALYLAIKYKPKAIILINHLFNRLPLSLMLTPIGKHFISYVSNLKPDIKNKNPVYLYNKVSSHNSNEIINLCNIIKKEAVNVNCPVLLFKSKQDHRVHLSNTLETFKLVSSKIKKIIWLYNSYHIVSLDNDKDYVLENILKFIRDI